MVFKWCRNKIVTKKNKERVVYPAFFFFFKWLCWVFVSVWGLSLVVASGGHSSSRCAGLSLSRPLLLRSTGSRCAGSVIVAHGLSCSAECGIFPDQGSNPYPLHWQADSQPLRHQGSPLSCFSTFFLSHFLLSLLQSFIPTIQKQNKTALVITIDFYLLNRMVSC